MLPFQYRENKINSIRFRNVSTINRKFYILIEPLNTNLTEQNQQQLQNESNYKQFSSQTTQLCLNPNFELDEESSEFLEQFESLSTCNNQLITLISSLVDVLIKLRALHDPQFKVDFHVNFQNLELIARDMSQVREYDFELVVFKFENLFYTTNALFHKLQETNLINMSIQDIRAKFYKKKDNEQQIPTLAFMTKFNKLMIGISQYKTLKSDNKRYQLTLQDKMQQLHELKSQKLDRIKQLKQQIEDKKKLIESKRVKNFEVSTNQKKIDRFATEKLSEGKYYQEVFKAFKTKLIDDTKNSQQKFLNSDLCKVIYLQRQTKCLFELFQIFFTPEAMKLYSGLKYFTTNSQLRNKYLDSQKYEIKLSVALGQIVQVVMHLSVCLGAAVKNPMIFNGHRSLILNTKQEPIPLYLSMKTDYKYIDIGIQLLEANLKRIYRHLDRLKDVYHINQERDGSMPNMPFPNNIFALLYKICEFQV